MFAFLVGLALVGGGIFGVLYMNRGSHVELKGEILKVRSLADGDGAIVFADFRVTNTAAYPFVVNSVEMTMETPDNEVAKAVVFSKSDVEKVTRYLKLLGPKYNDVLSIQDKLPPVRDGRSHGRGPVPVSAEVSPAAQDPAPAHRRSGRRGFRDRREIR